MLFRSGLIQTTQEQRRTKVPVIGDIPVIGLPFRTKLEESKKTELLVIVTPRVIPGVPGTAHGMAEDVTNQSVERMEDPSRVLDYLENIKAEIKSVRDKSRRESSDSIDQAWPTEPGVEVTPDASPSPETVIPAPKRPKPTYLRPQDEKSQPK